MKIINLSIIAILILAAPAIAQTALDVEFYIHQDGKAELIQVTPVIGYFDEVNQFEQDYKLVVLDKTGIIYLTYFPVDFTLYTDPPRKVDKTWVKRRVPYIGNVGQIQVYKQDTPILVYYPKDLCNYDGVCNNDENYISCSADCPNIYSDDICVSEVDNICDPDCGKDVDIDCFFVKKVEPVTRMDIIEENLFLITLLVIFGVGLPLAGIAYFALKKKPKRHKNHKR